MNLRYIGHVLFVFLFVGAVTELWWTHLDSQVGWVVLIVSLTILALLFPGWKSIARGVGAGAKRATPHLKAGATVVAGSARANMAATAAIVGLLAFLVFTGMAIHYDSRHWAQAAAFAFYITIFFSILAFWGAQVFVDNAKAYWVAVSVIGAFHSFAFDWKGWIPWAFVASAVVGFFGPDKVVKALLQCIASIAGWLGKLFSGKFGKFEACIAWFVVTFILAVVYAGSRRPGHVLFSVARYGITNAGFAFVLTGLALVFFIAIFMVGVGQHIEKNKK